MDEFLRVEGCSFIYANGDNALAMNPSTGKPVPAGAQFALQQGRLVADNIYADVVGSVRKSYSPKFWGEVISLGKHLAVSLLAHLFAKKITFIGFL